MELTLENIKHLADNHEGFDVEFKATTGQLDRGMETLCGMLNDEGGIVVFGVTDSGKIKGQEIGDKTTREIGEALNRFEPAIAIQPQYLKLSEEKYLIAFQAEEPDSGKPFTYDGRAWRRKDSVTSVMPQELYVRMLEKRKGLIYNWEKQVNENLRLADIDQARIKWVIKTAISNGRLTTVSESDSIETILKRLKLSSNGNLTNGAAVLFGTDFFDYPQCTVRLARFKGTDKRVFIDNRQVEGNIFQIIEATTEFFIKHLNLMSHMEGFYRKDELDVPIDALRECISNACAHRAWQRESSTIGVAIYDDRIEIENAGRFPYDLTPDKIIANDCLQTEPTSEPPNKIIAKVLYYCGLIEHWGRGLALMFSECARVGLPAPQIKETGSVVKVIFTRPGYKQGTSRAQAGHKQGTSTEQAEAYVPKSNNVRKLIEAIGTATLTMNEIMTTMGFRSRSQFHSNYMKAAIEDGAVEMENPDSPNDSNQKYRLTSKGLGFLNSKKDN